MSESWDKQMPSEFRKLARRLSKIGPDAVVDVVPEMSRYDMELSTVESLLEWLTRYREALRNRAERR